MKINKSRIEHLRKADSGMLKVFLRLDERIWMEYMYPAELKLYMLTKPEYIRIIAVQER